MQSTVSKTGATSRAGRPVLSRFVRVIWVVAALAAMAVVVVLVARFTLRPVPGARPDVHSNTDPGATLKLYLDRPSIKAALLEIGGNLALLAPLGMLLPVLFARMRRVLWLALAVGLVSLTIETAQGLLIAGRSFDVDDVILNTAGALLAYLLIGRRLGRWARTPFTE